MKLNYILSHDKLTIILNGLPQSIFSDDPRFSRALKLIETQNISELEKLLKNKNILAATLSEFDNDLDFEQRDGKFYYGGFEVCGALKDTLLAMVRQGFSDLTRWKKFVYNLSQNPSSSSVNELFDFMGYKQLPINEDGYVVAYRGVGHNLYSKHGNKQTVVLQGKVNDQGQILNEIGSTIEVARNQVDDERSNGCSYGLHVGSYDYASSWGQRHLLVTVNPADVVSVPKDSSCQKMRVCKYHIVEEVTKEVEVVSVDTNSNKSAGNQIAPNKAGGNQEVVNKIVEYIKNKLENDDDCTLKQIQSRMKGYKLSCLEILNIINNNADLIGEYDIDKSSGKTSQFIVYRDLTDYGCGCCDGCECDNDWFWE